MLYRAENISVFVEGCNFKIKCPKKLRPAGDYCHLKVSTLKVNTEINIHDLLLSLCLHSGLEKVKTQAKANIFFFFLLFIYLLFGWHLSIWNCCKSLFSLLQNCQLPCFWWFALSVVVKVFPLPSFQILLLQGYLIQTISFKISKSNLSSFVLWEISSFVALSVHFIFSIPIHLHVSNAFTTLSSFFPSAHVCLSVKSNTANTTFYKFLFYFQTTVIRTQ